MAYAALVSLSQTIHTLLRDDQHRYPISPHEKQQIMSIHNHVIFLQAFFENFPNKSSSLEGRITEVANEIEDIIEYFMWKQIYLRQNYASKSALGAESIEVSHSKGMCFDFKNLEKVIQKIESIAEAVMEIENSTRSSDDGPCIATCSSSSAAAIIAPPTSRDPIVGFEDDLTEIKSRLCGESRHLQVIPIYGMGGIGKTTLARNAYYDQLTTEHFQIRAWVTVSQDYSAPQILSSLFVSVGAHLSKENDESEMAGSIYKSLKGMRYLIVMDDMWSRDAWDDVRRIFPDDHNGSRVLLTTRLLDVAAYPNSSSRHHEMRFMDLEQSWNLLRKKVFPQENCPPELEDIGMTIASSCRGLPLAIVTIAGLLSTVSKTQASWKNIARNVNKVVTANNERFAKIILSLSYDHLPHHLRPCFLYMGSFPEDYEIHVSKLTKLWVAEGFLELPNGSKSSEEAVAEEYLEDLVKRSLVLVMKRKSNGKIKSCNVHDLVRDLCMTKAQQEKFLVHVHDSKVVQESLRNQRRIIFEKESHLNFLGKINGQTIHSIIYFGRRPVQWFLISLRNYRLLRVFETAKQKFKTNPFEMAFLVPHPLNDAVFELFHLRYLSVNFPIKNIPTAISKLENLQTLIIDPREPLRGYQRAVGFFPLEIWRMSQLRHLISFGYCCLPDPAGEAFALENLQTLSVANFVCSERTVKMIPNLKKLGIGYVGGMYDDKYYHLENLVHLRHLEKLKLEVHEYFPSRKKLMDPIFPRTLKKLTMVGWSQPWEKVGFVIGSLRNLEVLKLRDFACVGEKWETSEGEFCQLKFLQICKSNLQQWITESSHFPRLERLVLQYCWSLNEIPDGIGEISTLELIEIEGGNESLWDSAKRIEEEQRSWGNDALQFRLRR